MLSLTRVCSLLLLLLQLQLVLGKIFERCELAGLLRHKYGLPAAQVATLVCIAQHSSDLNTASFGGGSGPGGGSHGLFQISDVFWCSPPGQGAGCGVSCARLRDEDIADDVLCVRKIYAEHQRLTGDGFTAWQAYNTYCRQDAAAYVANCGLPAAQGNALHVAASYQQPQHVKYTQQHSVAPIAAVQHQQHHHQPQQQGKIYNRCELAQELFYQHKLPMQQIPTWVCIAQHESSYNTAAVGRLNADGSADHGLFQISDLFWCTHEQRAGKGCQASCNQFLDSSIADDVQCIRRIHQEHTQISGDGFTAWTVYNRDCRNQRYEQIAACFAKPQAPASHPNAIGGAVSKPSYSYSYAQQQPATTPNPYYRPSSTAQTVSYQSVHSTSSYQSNPFLRPRLPPAQSPAHPNAIGSYSKPFASSSANPFLSYNKQHTTHKQQTQQQYYQPQQQQQQHYYNTPTRAGKVYTRCELAQELYFSHKFPMQDIATWVCIAEHESRLDTAAVGRLNTDGSADHGLFQISDLYWCTHGEGNPGKGCHISCDRLLNSDISDDVKCIRTIHEEHTRLSGDGFTAWTVYNGHCRQRDQAELASCFDGKELHRQPTKSEPPKAVSKPKPQGKIYNRCELAQELFYKHKLPMQQIPTWVCIAQHESSFNTAAVGRLNADGSEDHGLFQISDLYWCSHESDSGKACHIDCNRLLDSDISDDVKCIRTIHEEHTRLSGDGFTAWTVYNAHCRQQSLAELSDCFKGNEIAEAVKPNHYGEKPQVPVVQHAALKTENKHVYASNPDNKHDYASNPFLQHFSGTHAAQATVQVVKSTLKPPAAPPAAVEPSHNYASNPFLHFQPTVGKPMDHPIKFVEASPPSKASFEQNIYLNQIQTSAANNIQTTVAKIDKDSNSFAHSSSYSSNPFLSKLSQPVVHKSTIATTTKPKSSLQAAHHSYISSDSFRKELIKFTATSTATTQASQLSQTKTTSRPSTTTRSTTTARPLTIAQQFGLHSSSSTLRTTTNTPTTSKVTTAATTTHLTARQPTTVLTTRFTTTKPTVKATTKSTSRATTTTARPTIHATSRSTTTRLPARTSTTLPTTRSSITTKRSTTSNISTKSTTLRPSTYPTTKPSIHQTATTRATARPQITNTIPTKTTRIPTRNTSTTRHPTPFTTTIRPTSATRSTTAHIAASKATTHIATTTIPKVQSKLTTKPTAHKLSTTTLRPKVHYVAVKPTRTKSTENALPTTTTRPTAGITTTTRPTTRVPATIRSTARITTTRPTTRVAATTRSTARITTTRPTARTTTTARSTTRSTARTPITTRSTAHTKTTTRSTTRAPTTTRSTTRFTATTRPSVPPTTTWHPLTNSYLTTTTYPKTAASNYNFKYSTLNTTTKTTTRFPTTSRPSATQWSVPSALRSSTSTTPRPYLFTSTKATTTSKWPTATATTTTRRPTTTTRTSTVTTTTRRPTTTTTTAKSVTYADPFDHPFFAKFKAKFEANRDQHSKQTKPTTNQSKFTASSNYAKFQENSAKVAAKTAYAYDFGQNRANPTALTSTKS